MFAFCGGCSSNSPELMKHLFLVLLAIFFAGCAHRDVVPNSNAPLIKSEARREATAREALAGDNAAANRMGDYYLAEKDRANSIWWYQLAAKRGDQTAKDNLKKVLQETQ
jgi:TPR repeat protein